MASTAWGSEDAIWPTERRGLLLEAAPGGEGAGARLHLVEHREVRPGRRAGNARLPSSRAAHVLSTWRTPRGSRDLRAGLQNHLIV